MELQWFWEPLWDTMPINSEYPTPFFIYPVGFTHGLGEKKIIDTNMIMAGALPQPQMFRMYGFAMEFRGDYDATVKKLIRSAGMFRFIKNGNHILYELPLRLIPINPVCRKPIRIKYPTMDFGITKLMKSNFYFISVNPKPMIEPGECFRSEVFFPDKLPPPVKMTCYLIGERGRGG